MTTDTHHPLQGKTTADQLIPGLLALDGDGFVRQAYRALLGREVDPQGLHYYVGLLREGWSKAHVLGLLWRCDECRRYAPDVPGMGELVQRHARAQLRGWRGWYLRHVKGVESDLPADRRLRALGMVAHGAVTTQPDDRGNVKRRLPDLVPGGNALALGWGGQLFTEAISLGTMCHGASELRRLGLRAFSGPFDWLFTTPEIVAHALKDNFRCFLDSSQFVPVPDADKVDMSANQCDHRYYREVFGQRYMFNHHRPDQPRDAAHFQRSVQRFCQRMTDRNRRLLLLMLTYEHMPNGRLQPVLDALPSEGATWFLLVVQLRVVPGVEVAATEPTLVLGRGVCHALVQMPVSAHSDGLTFANAADNARLENLIQSFKVTVHSRPAVARPGWWSRLSLKQGKQQT